MSISTQEASAALAALRFPWVAGETRTPVGCVPQVTTVLSRRDRLGAFKVRCGVGRMRFVVPAGLYAVGTPTERSLVFVSANYKLSFDSLRARLGGLDAWILVLDTKGINVWCAAGKGTFGTDELVARIEATGLKRIVSYRRLIVPQLGAPGVAVHEVKKRSGFQVVYGPVRASDIRAFVEAGFEATSSMRRVRFNLGDRLILVPVEIMQWGHYVLFIAAALFLLSGIHRGGYDVAIAIVRGSRAAVLILAAFLGSAILVPMLLPWIPGRAFSVKGGLLGLLISACTLLAGVIPLGGPAGVMEPVAWFLLIPSVSAFVAMNYTGTTTFTSQSGVEREMRFAVPAEIAGAIVGFALWAASGFVT